MIMLSTFFIGCGNSNSTKTAQQTTANSTKIRLHISSTEVTPKEVVSLYVEQSEIVSKYSWWDENGNLIGQEPDIHWVAPAKPDTYTITLALKDTKGIERYKSVHINVKEDTHRDDIPADDGSFTAISSIIADAYRNTISDATYICVGDSTRAESRREGQYLYYQLRDTLNQYHVHSHLLARAGHTAEQFLNQTLSPSWSEVADIIPAQGNHAIVDISLGINDYWAGHSIDAIKNDIKTAIAKIKARKPRTHFMLTMPNRVYHDRSMTNNLRKLYISLSQELHIPLNNTIDNLMPTQEDTPYSWYLKDGFEVHLSREGQQKVADFILGNILPF